MKTSDGIVLWSLGAAGTLLVYSGYKNLKPQSVLMHYFTGAAYTATDQIQDKGGQMLTLDKSKLPTTPLLPGQKFDPTAPYVPPLFPGQQAPTLPDSYNTRGVDPQTMPAAYQNSPASFLPAKAMTA